MKTGNMLVWMKPSRIQALADGIFAFAMTLLVLNLILPDPTNLPQETELHEMLLEQAQAFYNYALSFLLLAIFWMIHSQQLHIIKETSLTHLWMNMIILLFIVLVPFSTSLMSDYPTDTLANLVFAVNMFIIGALYYFNWHYAVKGRNIIDDKIDIKRVEVARRRSLLTPCIAVIAIVLAFIAPEFTGLSFLLIPILRFVPPFN